MIVYVALLDEGTPCWRPADADHISDDIYKLRGAVPDGEVWEFQPGELVRCALRKSADNQDIFAVVARTQ